MITAYVIAAIVVIPLTPWLMNRFGRRNYFLVSIVGFTLASVLCRNVGVAHRAHCRARRPGRLRRRLAHDGAIDHAGHVPPAQLAASQGIFAIGAIIGPTLGPPLGGYLVDNFSWNWCFEINIAPGIFSVVVLLLLLRDPSKANNRTPIDAVGLALLAAGLAALQYILTEGEQNDWFNDSTILTIAMICVASLATFVWWELTQTDNPVVDLRILRNRSVWAELHLALWLGVSVFGASYTLQFTQGSLGYTPTLGGLLFMSRAIRSRWPRRSRCA